MTRQREEDVIEGRAAYGESGDPDAGGIESTYDVEQRLKFDQLAMHREPSRQEVIEELIAEKRKLNIARRSGVDVPDSDVGAAYAAGLDEFQKNYGAYGHQLKKHFNPNQR